MTDKTETKKAEKRPELTVDDVVELAKKVEAAGKATWSGNDLWRQYSTPPPPDSVWQEILQVLRDNPDVFAPAGRKWQLVTAVQPEVAEVSAEEKERAREVSEQLTKAVASLKEDKGDESQAVRAGRNRHHRKHPHVGKSKTDSRSLAAV